MDVQMPFMDGFETTQYIRKKDKDIPIVALTANAMREDVNETKRAGMNEHLSKPINIEKLYTVLLKYISKKVPVPTNKSKNKEDINIPDFIHINTTIGLSHMANNKKLYMKILHDFYTSYSTLELKKLNNKELQITLHTIKGLSANIGAIKLSAIAQELEKTLHKKLFYDFHKQLSNVLEELKNITYYTKTKTLLPLDTNKKNKLFSTLKEYAHKRRGRECKKVLQEFKTYSLTQENKLLLDKIDLYLNTRNYKNIVEILNEQ
jgi:CheY-like chemotaxis protein